MEVEAADLRDKARRVILGSHGTPARYQYDVSFGVAKRIADPIWLIGQDFEWQHFGAVAIHQCAQHDGITVYDLRSLGQAAGRQQFVAGDDETGFLQELDRTLESGLTPADELLSLYHGEWNRDLSQIFKALAY